MILQPHHLKHFRTRYALTQAWAAALTRTDKLLWRKWELGQADIPAHLENSIRGAAGTLNAALAKLDRMCRWCRKDVTKWRASGGRYCPYCNRLLYQSKLGRIRAVLPERILIKR